ncbi:FG-GAP repeat domain-containing protein [Streptomyces sp. c-19]|uniref:FG-GAP repeat domain-containing protein n=1 Tax=Streptomyces sp. c-19 TaxID=2789275 RepID=UPI00397FC5A5
MTNARTPRRRLAAAITVALAVTAGPVMAGPAVATPGTVTVAAQATATQQDVIPFRDGATVAGAGRTGFLSRHTVEGKAVYEWTRYADGTTTALPAGTVALMGGSDVVTQIDGSVHTLHDMATDAKPVAIDLGLLGDGYGSGRGLGPSTLFATRTTAAGGKEAHVVSIVDGTLLDDKVTGLSENAAIRRVFLGYSGTVVVRYDDAPGSTPGTRIAVIDVEKRQVVEDYEAKEGGNHDGDVALSPTHIAWIERPTYDTADVVVVRRDTRETKRVPLGKADTLSVELAGDWLLYGQTGGYNAYQQKPLHALTAQSLTSGETVKLLDHFTSSAPGPDGTQLVRGGTVAEGEGVYRIAPATDGARPSVTLVASTGQPTTLELLRHDVPETIDLDRAALPLGLNWTLSRSSTRVRVELVHTATKKTWKPSISHYAGGVVGFKWDGVYAKNWMNANDLNNDAVPAPNGDYTWRLTAEPRDGIGPAVEKTGAFKVVRETVPHDFNDNGTPDLLIREPSGHLSLYNTSAPLGSWPVNPAEPLGTGWDIYDALLSPGDVAGDAHSDIVARDKNGVLWLHQGTGRALAPRARVGGGWQIYNRITGGSDLTGDGRADLVATDKAGDLWLYKGTGNASAPFAPRVKTGHGWGIYNKITAAGDIGGGPAGDLVARDTAGDLWLYLGTGNGTFAPRTRIGGGWNTYSDIVGFGDVDRDGRPDLLGVTAAHGTPYFYKGTGAWKVPFAPRSDVYSYAYLGGTAF